MKDHQNGSSLRFPLKPLAAAVAAPGLAIGLWLPAGAAAEEAVLEEVVVTSTKREASLQEIPLSISAVSGEKLQAAGIQDFEDVAASVPSLSFKSSGPGRTKLNIRGISSVTGVAPTVSYYIDEMPISTISSGSSTSFASTIVSPKMFDLDRVEILRGPQGTLFGSSSMGGTVRIITAQPNLDSAEGRVAAEFSSTAGGGMNYLLNGMGNMLLGENAALRVEASSSDRSGFVDRVFEGGSEEDVDAEETQLIRAALRYQLTDSTYIQPAVFHQTLSMDGKPNFDGPDRDDEQVRPFDAAEPFEDTFTLGSVTLGSDFETLSLGTMSLVANFSIIDRRFDNVEDMTDHVIFLQPIFGYDMPSAAALVDESVTLDDRTLEIRLSSQTDSDFQWLAGFYRKDAEVNADYRMDRGFEYVTANGLANTNDRSSYEETAFFGEGSLTFASDFTFTLGLRRLEYDFEQHKEDWGFAYAPIEGLSEAEANILDVSASDEELNYRATLAWQFSEMGQVYATASDATRPGGGNRSIPRSEDPGTGNAYACNNDLNALGISGNPTTYAGDVVDNLELGLKLQPTDSLRINTAVYRIDWKDIQQRVNTSGACGFNFTANVGGAVSTGFELEAVAAVTERLTLNAGVGYTDAEFTETVSTAGITEGDRLTDVPEMTASLSADWSMPLASGEVFVLGSINYVDETLEVPGSASSDVSGFDIDSGNAKPSYTIANLRIGYASFENWEASFFVDNLTDEVAIYSYNDAIVFNLPGFDRTARNRPRTMGLSAQYSF
ncbi:TonB-dependent receptor [Microbulbifer taiwanensis]|uniref:TonB-dependent receptor n=1 Tax=Microbulbifer taiwanensis TaxID=986746 RepID=A0ABW1YL18_9GAMM|nr:TonB-dependent receptor [Microbulbifer taiwanensis]